MEDERTMKGWKVEPKEVYGIFRNKEDRKRRWSMRVGG
jgi:hypothetical protein